MKEIAKAKVAGEREVLATLSAVMRGDMADYVVRKGSGGEEVMQVPVKLADRMHAAELLGKQLGLFSTKGAETVPPVDVAALEALFCAARREAEQR